MIDAAEFWWLFRTDRGKLYTTIGAAYPLMPLHYVMYFIDCFAELEGNPRAMTYVESDLGAAGRARELIHGLVAGGAVRVAGARCLDIGCSNGARLVAAQAEGARAGVGIDVDPRRLESARRVGLGRKQLEFLKLDASTEPLPGMFDTIFCNDVLEHVSDWQQLLRHAAKALTPEGTMFLSLHNARQPSVVLSEPHYGVPGLVLLPPADAAACWGRVRGVVGSALDYDVTTWPLYLDVAALCADLDLVVSPWVDCAPAFGPAFWEAPHADITTAGVRARAALARFPEPDASNLQAAVDRYVARAVSDFAHAARSTTNAEAARLANFITYHSQPLNLLLRPLA